MVCGNHFEGGRLTNHRDPCSDLWFHPSGHLLFCAPVKRQRSTWQRCRDDLELHHSKLTHRPQDTGPLLSHVDTEGHTHECYDKSRILAGRYKGGGGGVVYRANSDFPRTVVTCVQQDTRGSRGRPPEIFSTLCGWNPIFLKFRPCAFFSMFLVTLFSPNLRGRAEKNKMPKEKKNTGRSVSQTTWPTNDIPNLLCWAQSYFCYFLPNNDRVKQLPVATKVWLFLVLVLDLTSRAKNVLESSTQTFINIANAFVLPRSLVRWEARLRFRFQTKHISWCFCQSKTSLLSAESTFDDFNRKDLGFWFQWLDSVTRLLPPNSRKRASTVEVFSMLWRMCMNGEHHAF